MSFNTNLILLGAAGAGGPENWILEGPTTAEVGRVITLTVDSNENIYILTSTGTIIKVNKDGQILWATNNTTGGAGDSEILASASGDIYYVSPTGNGSIVAKINPANGNVVWARNTADTYGTGVFFFDSLSTLYYAGAGTQTRILRFDSDGNEFGPLRFSSELVNFSNGGIDVDVIGSIYVGGTKSSDIGGNTRNRFFAFKLNNNLTLSWAKLYAYSSSTSTNRALAAGLNGGSFYIAGYFNTSGSDNPSIILKINGSSGALEGSARANSIIPGSTTVVTQRSQKPYITLKFDSAGDGYYFGDVNCSENFSKTVSWLWKRNSNLGIYYANYFIFNPGVFNENTNQAVACGAVPGPGNSVYCLFTKDEQRLYLAKVPKDGSKTGTYAGVSGTIGYLPYNQQTGGPLAVDLGSVTLNGVSSSNVSTAISSTSTSVTSFSQNLIQF